MRVFVHGSGRVGKDAWPTLPADAGVFAAIDPTLPIDDQTEALRELVRSTGPDTIVAHSWGGVVAVLAMMKRFVTPQRLVLVEPALYDLVRGDVSVEGHIAVVTAARARAEAGDLRGFWDIIKPNLFGKEATDADWLDDRDFAARFASMPRPWGHGLEAVEITLPPTLVITGNWNREYEAIAHRLTGLGAQHRHLEGAQHRPQDLDGFLAMVEGFERGAREEP